MTSLMSVAAIGVLGAAGALVRYGLVLWFRAAHWPSTYSTVLANIIGSAGAGLVIAADGGMWSWWLAAGLFGAITTLSTVAVDVAEELRLRRKSWWALVLWHVLGGLVGFLVGFQIGAVAF